MKPYKNRVAANLKNRVKGTWGNFALIDCSERMMIKEAGLKNEYNPIKQNVPIGLTIEEKQDSFNSLSK